MPKRRKRAEPHPQRPLLRKETRAVEIATVVWMMSVMTTVVCGGSALLVLLVSSGQDATSGARIFGRLLHFSAFVSAVVSLILLGCVLKFREQHPPRVITWSALVVALVAIGTALLY